MFRPQRISTVSVICLRKDIDLTLEALHDFGNFHIEQTDETSIQTEYDRLIRQTEENIGKINLILDQLRVEKTGLFDLFKTVKTIKTQIITESWQSLIYEVDEEVSQLSSEVGGLTRSLENLRKELPSLNCMQAMLTVVKELRIDLRAVKEMHFIYVVTANVQRRNLYELEKALSGFHGIFYHCSLSGDVEFILIATPRKHKGEVEKILQVYHVEVFQLPEDIPHDSSQALERVNDRLGEVSQNEKSALSSLEKLAETKGLRLLTLRETGQNILNVFHARQKAFETERLLVIEGYVPKGDVDALRTTIAVKLNGRVLILEKEFGVSEDPPTTLHNPSLIKPFEEITRLYGVPHYDELDPTPIIALTFPLIFGLMFGDFGHGLVLLIGGSTLGLLIKNQRGFKSFSWILALCGVGAIFAGLLFGEFFGKQLFTPLWFDPFQDVTKLLLFSIFVGVTQIISGFVLDFGNSMIKGDVIDALTTSIPKIAFYLGSIYMILVCQLDFGLWFKGPILFPVLPFIFLIFGKPLIMKLLKASGHFTKNLSEHTSLIERVFESGDLVTRLLSNTISYVRIAALLMAHWALLLVTYVISGLVFPVLGAVPSILVIIVGNIFVIAFEGLIVFIHTLRLHFYEWFNKFYQGTGVEFRPFRQNYKYTKIVFRR